MNIGPVSIPFRIWWVPAFLAGWFLVAGVARIFWGYGSTHFWIPGARDPALLFLGSAACSLFAKVIRP